MVSNRERNTEMKDLTAKFWFGLPLVSIVLCMGVAVIGGADIYNRLIRASESSYLEHSTVIMLLPAIILSGWLFMRGQKFPGRWLGFWCLLLFLGSLYFAGEEASWGQTYFHWRTPEEWAELNKQRETNLHNLELLKYGPWVDLLDDVVNNIPRQILLLSCLAAAILPLALHRKLRGRGARRGFWWWVIPTPRLVPPAVVAVCSTLPEKLYDIDMDTRIRY